MKQKKQTIKAMKLFVTCVVNDMLYVLLKI